MPVRYPFCGAGPCEGPEASVLHKTGRCGARSAHGPVSLVNEVVVRLLRAYLTRNAYELLDRYQSGSEVWTVQQQFEACRVRIVSDDG